MKKKNTIIKMLALVAIFSAMLTSCKVSKKETTNNNAWTRPKTAVTDTGTQTTTTTTSVAGYNLKTVEITDEELGKCLCVTDISFTEGNTLPVVSIPDEINGIPVIKVNISSAQRYKIIPMISFGKNVKIIAPSINKNVAAVQVDSNNPYFSLINNVIYTKDGKKLVYAPAIETIDIASAAEEISPYSLYACKAEKINIPGNVKKICNYAFSSLAKDITLNEGLENIETNAFAYPEIDSVVIPASVTKIGGQNFWKVKNISVATENTVYDSRDNCNMIIETATNKVITAGSNCSFPSSVTSIGDYAFSYKTGHKSITVPATITSIGYGAFLYCYDLEELKILNKNCSINSYTFAGCRLLEKFSCPKTLNKITSATLSGCTGLKTLVIPEIVSIENDSFKTNKALEEIYFGESKANMETKFPNLGKDEEYYQNAKKYYYVSTKVEVDSATYDAWTYNSSGYIYTKEKTFYIA